MKGLTDSIYSERISWIRMGTTIATNALLERNGERIALIITKGFKDLLYIGNQSRPKIFDFDIKIPPVLYEEVVEVDERVIPFDESCQMGEIGREEKTSFNKVIVEKEPIENDVREILKSIKSKGINMCADAYLTPKIKEYIEKFEAGFSDRLRSVRVEFMQSDGGLCNRNHPSNLYYSFCGSKAILSGPAGGVKGIASTAYDKTLKRPVIGFDMGGTSTDVDSSKHYWRNCMDLMDSSTLGVISVRSRNYFFSSIFVALVWYSNVSRYSGTLEHVMETTTAGVTIQAPQLDINTVAAGGGSMLSFSNGIFVVGPESVGAHPGPVCYRKGGSLSITDANLVLGRILPEYFPKIFGPKSNEALDSDASYTAMEKLTRHINDYLGKNENSYRKSTLLKRTRCFFRSHAHRIIYDRYRSVEYVAGIRTVLIHKYSSLLSAYGIALAEVVSEVQEPVNLVFSQDTMPIFVERFKVLSKRAEEHLIEQGFDSIHCEHFLHMRFAKTDCAIMVMSDYDSQVAYFCFLCELLNVWQAFYADYKREFGFILENREIVIDDIRVRGIASSGVKIEDCIESTSDPNSAKAVTYTRTFFEHNCGGASMFSDYYFKWQYSSRYLQ
ncbi:hydantoinase/oxoprolinase [Dictyocaulus viviparus]|uniref:Hydantoinase/oxoprolinase n=1 Tax=Dictyocaulus viviparus TaxID=29172 RepID=A0A0D8Y7I8_DICVI|nr:hydantoinase/oxoprolinase [Dictyocaulus viviparus]